MDSTPPPGPYRVKILQIGPIASLLLLLGHFQLTCENIKSVVTATKIKKIVLYAQEDLSYSIK